MAKENVVEVVSDLHNGGTENGITKSVSFSAMKPQFISQASKTADAIQFYKSVFGAEELNVTEKFIQSLWYHELPFIVFTTEPASLGLNVALDTIFQKFDTERDASKGLQESSLIFGIPEAMTFLSLRSAALRSLKYSDGSYTACLLPV